MAQSQSIIVLSKKAAVREESLTEALRDDLAWYRARASKLKDPEKKRLVEASLDRIAQLLRVYPA